MTYTHEKPTVPGWYWYRAGGYEEIVRLSNSHSGEMNVEIMGSGDTCPLSFSDHDGQFAGPIPEPMKGA